MNARTDAPIDDTVRQARRIEQRNRQLEAALELDPNGIATFEPSGRLLHANAAFAAMLDWTAPDLADADLGLVARRLERCGAALDLPRLHECEPQTVVLTRARHVVATARRAADGSRVLHLRDVTHESEVDRVKNEFLAGAAHELRTPVASILGFAELMLHRELGAQHRADAVATIHRQAMVLMKTVQDMIDLARIDARRGKGLQIEPLAVGTLIDEAALADAGARSSGGGHRETTVRVDRARTVRAIGELLANARKFSEAGSTVDLRAVREGARVGIRVQDQGIGMTGPQCARVFERFWRAETSGHLPGAGLGMTLVREIVELQGGCVEVASEPGAGTTVTLWFPLADEPPLPAAAQG